MSDEELYVLRHTEYYNIKSDARASEAIAEDYNLSVSSVRGRLSRGAVLGKVALIKAAALDKSTDDPGIIRQNDVIGRSTEVLAEHRKLFNRKKHAAFFISDLHLPYARWDAVRLTALIMQNSAVPVAYISGKNDMLDNEGYGRWDESKTRVTSRIKGTHLRQIEKSIYSLWRDVAPSAVIVEVAGNHDNWWNYAIRNRIPNEAEEIIADYMEMVERWGGILQFTRGNRENYFQVSPRLIWWHGQYTSKNHASNAENSLSQFMRDGQAVSVVVGHTHRPYHVPGSSVGYPGVEFFNSGCLSRLEAIPYIKRDPKGWGLGIVRHIVDGSYTSGNLIKFEEYKGSLIANVEGTTYDVPVDKDRA